MINLNEQFKTQKEKNEAISKLRSLMDNPDWIFFMVNFIEKEITNLSEKILDEEYENLNDINQDKMGRMYLHLLANLPKQLTEVLERKDLPEWNFDPYYQDKDDLGFKKDKPRRC
jgi:hypothetical protein